MNLPSITKRSVALVVSVVVLVAGFAVGAGAMSPSVRGTIPMTCYPAPPAPGDAPGVGGQPPCLLPVDLPSEFVSPNPSGTLKYRSTDDGGADFRMSFTGLAPGLVLTAWISYFYPGIEAPPSPIFAPDENTALLAAVSAPLAPIGAGFSDGLGPEPNAFIPGADGKASLNIRTNYDPLAPNQGPLRNGLVDVLQTAAPAGSGAEQGMCCLGGNVRPQAIASSYLRTFDAETGFQNLADNGYADIMRSPVPVSFIAIVAHTDKQTHGINPGIPTLPIPGVSWTSGDHFLVGLFDLRGLGGQ